MTNIYQELLELLKNSYSPYSHFPVAAIIINKDKRVHKGVNVENASYPSGLCAERAAIFGAISYGWKPGEIVELHVITKRPDAARPCLACRQVMTEVMTDTSEVFMYSYDGKIVEKKRLIELAPNPIRSSDLF